MKKTVVSLLIFLAPGVAFGDVSFDVEEVMKRHAERVAFLEANPNLKTYPYPDGILRISGCPHPGVHMGVAVFCCPFGEFCEGEYGKNDPEFEPGPSYRWRWGSHVLLHSILENSGLNMGQRL